MSEEQILEIDNKKYKLVPIEEEPSPKELATKKLKCKASEIKLDNHPLKDKIIEIEVPAL